MKSSKNLLVFRRLAVCGLVSMTALSMGSMCSLLSLLGGSATPTPTIASTFPTKTATPIPTATVAGTATPSGSPTVTPTPAPPPKLDIVAPFVPAKQTKGLAMSIVGTNLFGTTKLTFSSISAIFTPVTLTTGFTVASDGNSISLLVPDLGLVTANDVQVTVTTPSGFVTSSSTVLFTYNP